MGGTDYIAFLRTVLRVPLECSPRLVWKFIYNFGWRNVKNMAAFECRQATGQPFFPAFVMISVTERCNLPAVGFLRVANGRSRWPNWMELSLNRKSEVPISSGFWVVSLYCIRDCSTC